ncbi:MAG: OstA-like protein [Bacteroidales bacterium]|nr:OstA-like protein [Bacteroidales bacterium]
MEKAGKYFIVFISAIIFLSGIRAFAQEKQKIDFTANTLEFDKSMGENIKRLIGNVVMWQGNVYIYCDSAHLNNEENTLVAYSKVHLRQNDTVNLYGDILHYNGNTKIADIEGNVILKDKQITLSTTRLTFDMNKNIGTYTTGARIVDKENTLRSTYGYFYANKNEFYFKKNVVLVNPEYITRCDTLLYNTVTKTSYFFGPTTIESDSDFIYCENGWYNSITNKSQFNKNAYLISKEQTIRGDSLFFDRNKGFGKAIGKVTLIDTLQKIIVKGDYSEYFEKTGNSFITGNTFLSQIIEDDTLFLHADTLRSVSDSTKTRKTLFAYHKAKFFKTDIQGMCDSLVYALSDSVIKLYFTPVLWSDENQLTAKYTEMRLKNKQIESIYMNEDAFIISQKDTSRYNQIKGTNMIGYVKNNELYKVFVNGNGETIYYIEDSKGKYMGINKAESENMIIYLKDKKVRRIKFINKPKAVLHPPENNDRSELYLKDFIWHENKRPLTKLDILNP